MEKDFYDLSADCKNVIFLSSSKATEPLKKVNLLTKYFVIRYNRHIKPTTGFSLILRRNAVLFSSQGPNPAESLFQSNFSDIEKHAASLARPAAPAIIEFIQNDNDVDSLHAQ